ncbi:MAG: trigger factor [Firmicutes bacterium]|nr:trigger factor [Alicyclobacillaceae bacterium]MCL6497000.1 trigger factor [Bacillota bacterium]
MQVVMERLPNAVAKVSVTIEPAELEQAMDKAFRKVVRRYNIPGFRPGKAPRPIFERFVGRSVILQEAAESLVEDRYRPALQEVGVEPVSQPRIEIISLEDAKPFQFSIEVEAKPEVEVPALEEVLRLPLVVPEVSPEDIDREVQNLAKSVAQLVPADEEPVAMGNRVQLRLKGFLENEQGEPESEPFAEEDSLSLEVGSGILVEGLETQLIGLKVGEPAVLRLTYPQDHPDAALAGKSARFEVVVLENKRPEIPPDDELAKTLGFDSIEELRQQVANRLSERREREAKESRLAEILGKLREQLEVELPPSMVRATAHRMVHEVADNLARVGVNFEDYLKSRQQSAEAFENDLLPGAEERVKNQLILEAVARQRGLAVDDEEVVQSLKPVAESFKQPLSVVVQLFRQRGEFEELRNNLLISKAREYLASTVVE